MFYSINSVSIEIIGFTKILAESLLNSGKEPAISHTQVYLLSFSFISMQIRFYSTSAEVSKRKFDHNFYSTQIFKSVFETRNLCWLRILGQTNKSFFIFSQSVKTLGAVVPS